MGVSTDGILFFGFPIPEDSETHERIEREKREGPEGEPNPGTLGWLAWNGSYDEDVEVGYHCSKDCTLYFVAFEESVVKAYRGYPKDLKRHPIYRPDEARDREWTDAIRDFCTKWSMPFTEPSWYLASYWG